MTMILFLGEWMVRSSVLILAGALLLWLMRVKNPSVHLTAWTAMLAGSLAMPLLRVALPKVPLPVMRSSAPTPEPVITLGWTRIPDSISTPTLPPAANAKTFDWMRFTAILYLLVMIALLVRLFGGLVMSLRILRRSRPAGIAAEGIEVRESDRLASPFTIGVVRPAILLPLGIGATGTPPSSMPYWRTSDRTSAGATPVCSSSQRFIGQYSGPIP